jgi:hypothetical protein
MQSLFEEQKNQLKINKIMSFWLWFLMVILKYLWIQLESFQSLMQKCQLSFFKTLILLQRSKIWKNLQIDVIGEDDILVLYSMICHCLAPVFGREQLNQVCEMDQRDGT